MSPEYKKMVCADQDNEKLTRFVETLRGRLSSDAVYVSRVSASEQIFLISTENSPVFPTGTTIDLDRSICKHVASMNFPLVVDDTQSHPLIKDNPTVQDQMVAAYAGYPVRDPNRRVLAVVSAVFEGMHRWSQSELEILADAADDAAQYLVS